VTICKWIAVWTLLFTCSAQSAFADDCVDYTNIGRTRFIDLTNDCDELRTAKTTFYSGDTVVSVRYYHLEPLSTRRRIYFSGDFADITSTRGWDPNVGPNGERSVRTRIYEERGQLICEAYNSSRHYLAGEWEAFPDTDLGHQDRSTPVWQILPPGGSERIYSWIIGIDSDNPWCILKWARLNPQS
jgi:hypothetical protein